MPTFGTTRGKSKRSQQLLCRRGTTAHELAELYLAKRFKLLTARAVNSIEIFERDHPYYDESMKEYVTAYCDLVEERVNQYENATVELEQK